MATREAKDLIGLDIVYSDYLGFDRNGKIGWFEPYHAEEYDDEGNAVVWLYIVDEDPEYNTHTFIFNASNDMLHPDMKRLAYAELRLSTEVRIVE